MLVIPLQRLRVELDRTLRTRHFIGRAVRGQLNEGELLDLLTQLRGLSASYAGLAELSEVFAEDAARLEADAQPAPALCPGVRFHSTLVGLCQTPPELLLCVLGTSWCRDAAEALHQSHPHSTRGLAELSAAGLDALRALDPNLDPLWILTQAELTRGSLLGLAAYLDLTWPATLRVAGTRSFA